MKMFLLKYLLVGAAGAFLVSCASQPEVVEDKKPAPRYIDRLVGKVSSYEPDTGIVLIQMFNRFKPLEADVFLTRGEGGTVGNVKLSGQANKFFLAAEYQSGVVNKGDVVYRRRLNPHRDKEETSKPNNQPLTIPESDVKKVEPVNPPVVDTPPERLPTAEESSEE